MIETKSFKFDIADASDEGIIEGYAAVFGNVDQGYDLIEPGAFKKTIRESKGVVPILWAHDSWEPIGVSTSLEEDDKGLRMVAELNLKTRRGVEALALAQQKALRGLSIGYRTVKETYEGTVRRLAEVKLREVSMVVFPMNELALVTNAKAETIARALQRAERDIRNGRVTAETKMLLDQAVEALEALRDGVEPASGPLADDEGAATPDEGKHDEPPHLALDVDRFQARVKELI